MSEQLDILEDSAEQLQQMLSDLEQLSHDERETLSKRWPSNLQSLYELLRHSLAARGIKESDSHAQALAAAIGNYMGGRDLYIPAGALLKKALKNIEIWREYNGRNLAQLAQKHRLTERRVAQIIQEQRKAEQDRRQQKLF